MCSDTGNRKRLRKWQCQSTDLFRRFEGTGCWLFRWRRSRRRTESRFGLDLYTRCGRTLLPKYGEAVLCGFEEADHSADGWIWRNRWTDSGNRVCKWWKRDRSFKQRRESDLFGEVFHRRRKASGEAGNRRTDYKPAVSGNDGEFWWIKPCSVSSGWPDYNSGYGNRKDTADDRVWTKTEFTASFLWTGSVYPWCW